jgi:exodeoxyribonuclease-3
MKIVSWNINSVRARLSRLLAWLERHQPDVLCLQETKVTDGEFPRLEIEAMGYSLETDGQKGYNGVAILSRGAFSEVARGFPGGDESQKRVIAATVYGIRIVNLYVPNGKSVGSEYYAFKLEWLTRFLSFLDAEHVPSEPLLVCGDLNIAPEDRDTYDPDVWRGRILCSEPERERFRALLDWGLSDALRLGTEDGGIFTWWDYRMGGFRRNKGLRIDHFLVTRPVAERVREVVVDREERGGDKPSDHAPLVVTLEKP